VVVIGGLSIGTLALGFAIGAAVAIILGRLITASSKSSVRPPRELL